ATGVEVGKYGMTFTKESFENLNKNFSAVNITIVEDSLEITPITVDVTITKHGLTEAYDGETHSVSGYDFVSSNPELFKRDDLKFIGEVSDSIATGVEVGKYGMKFDENSFENLNKNFSAVNITIVEDSLEITPITVDVTITKHSLTEAYDGETHTVSGYDFVSSNPELFKRDDLKFIGEVSDSIATGVEVGKYGMKFDENSFENLNHNFSAVNITIVEDSLEITPITVDVTITKHGLTEAYDGETHTVSGYDFLSSNPELFKRDDLKFIGEVSDSIATGVEVGKYGMKFDENSFENLNKNFSAVNITIVEDSLEITPITVDVTITKHSLTEAYDGETHTVSGYDFVSSNPELFKRDDLKFIGEVSDSIATGVEVGKYGMK
ncbi:MAG: MucBP domain-containing protein, partial [Fibrobacter sp.]|nr:MucBP domain-containing protein [Fibrobacter sp.]